MVKFIKPELNVCMPPVLMQLFTTVQELPYMTGCRTSFTRLYNCTLDKGLTSEASLDAQGFPLKKVDCGNCIDCPFFHENPNYKWFAPTYPLNLELFKNFQNILDLLFLLVYSF